MPRCSSHLDRCGRKTTGEFDPSDVLCGASFDMTTVEPPPTPSSPANIIFRCGPPPATAHVMLSGSVHDCVLGDERCMSRS